MAADSPLRPGTLAPATLAVTAGRPDKVPDAPLNTPITMAATYVAGGEVEYGRYGNPTWTALEDALGALEGGRCLTFASGLAAVATVLALTFLNPHVYLDTVVLLGSVANTHGDDRWYFGAGAALGSVLWFSVLGFGARFLRPLFRSHRAWRILDAAVAALMFALALSLALGS